MTATTIALALLSATAAGNPPFTIAPTPDWVAVETVPPARPDTGKPTPIRWRLSDEQVQVSGDGNTDYTRIVKEIRTTAGMQDESELSIEFDPSYQRLILHHITIVRGDQRIEALHAEEIRIIQQESDLAEQLYNGRLTALAFLRDVRVGDVIDYAWSIEGANPILAGHFNDGFALAWSSACDRIHYRLLWPSNRHLDIRTHGTTTAPVVTPRGALTEYVWTADEVPALEDEDATPSWYEARPWVQLTDFGSWAEVATWASKLMSSRELSEPMRAQVAKWMAEHASDEDRAEAAIRFVQDEVRYLGFEVGPNTHVPHPPPEVFAQRFGDCKDKAVLIVTLLGAMGIQAEPALVHSRRGRSLDDWAPSAWAFNHVIAHVTVGGRERWIDGTRSLVGGRAIDVPNPPFERALLARPDATGLVRIASPTLGERLSVELDYDVPGLTGPTSLTIRTVYGGAPADAERSEASARDAQQWQRSRLNFFARFHPSIAVAAPPSWTDDQAKNEIHLEEHYRIEQLWVEDHASLIDWPLGAFLTAPQVTLRKSPLAVDHPTELSMVVRAKFPSIPPVSADATTIDGPAAQFSGSKGVEGTTAVFKYGYHTTADVVPVADLPKHLEMNRRIRDYAGYTFTTPMFGGLANFSRERPSPAAIAFAIVIAIGILGALIGRDNLAALGRPLRWRRGKKRVAPVRLGEARAARRGDTPATAILAAGLAEIAAMSTGLSCGGCGEKLKAAATVREDHAFRKDGELIIPADVRCSNCSTVSKTFFKLPSA